MSGSLENFFSLSPHSSGSGRSRRYLVDKSFRFDQKDPLVASVSHFSFLYSTVQGQIRKEVSTKIGGGVVISEALTQQKAVVSLKG